MSLTKNPVLRDDTFRNQGPFVGGRGDGLPSPVGGTTNDAMTIRGVITKGAILLLLMAATFIYTWDKVLADEAAGPWIMLGGIGGFIVSIVLSFKPRLAPFLAPVFALLEGLLLGGISAYYTYAGGAQAGTPKEYDGIVFQAALCTVGTFAAMLALYRTRIIKVTSRFRQIVSVAMLGVVAVYFLTFILNLFGSTVPFIHENTGIGIAFSILVIGIASMMLLVDFDMIEQGAATGAPKYMEWYGAFALLVTVIWIYLEFLRLLSKLRSR